MHGRYYREKTQAGCSSFLCLQGGDEEAAESGTEMVVRLGIFGRRGMVAEMPSVLAARAEPTGKGAKIDLAQGWTKWHEKDEPKPV